ncbi:MAG: aminotransferase class III-fold pyridoxal phosphate-dependent enzyme [Ignavibacteriales bacterium]|nr:aminotransferase class III-fold pyridoxal phosphate-dependent enzyme [Ignavibacteriales bacterium]MCF8316726.1 aminotransferase class III-fold pyridoxal phosphate-dependent enzyme [Ignavibacteriales bacterium]MCF8436040.1 aminotransferase class III-fold pyridoxal phosphate-dependent enzyme [Ignavibacteriales bacterium]
MFESNVRTKPLITNFTNSELYYDRSKKLIPGYTQTMAKGPTQYVNGASPKYLRKGKGSKVRDVDGNVFIDYNMAIGPLSLGYSYDRVDAAILSQLADGITFSMMSPLEVETAELIREFIPNAESVRYGKTGGDVTTAAVRLARAYTGRKKILCCGYHGWHDWYIGVTARNHGVPEEVRDLTYTFNYNDLEGFAASIDEETAAVILEPVVFEAPKNNFLHEIEKLCKEYGVLLIFDEMWTGFRMSLGGAQKYFGITPDLAVYSKAIANGMPLSVITGRYEIMSLFEEQVFFYTTFGGEALSLAAAKATMAELKEKNVPAHLNKIGALLKDGYNSIAASLGLDFTKAVGYNWRSMVTFSSEAGDPLLMKSFVQQEMISRGVLWGGYHNISYSHSEKDVDYTLGVYEIALKLLKNSLSEGSLRASIRGLPVQPVFRKTENFNMRPVLK